MSDNKEKKNFKDTAKKVKDGFVSGAKTIITTTVDTGEEILKYYEKHKNVINTIGVFLFGTAAWKWSNNGGFLNNVLNNDRMRTYDSRYMSRDERDRLYYDPRTRHYVRARRRLTMDEEAELYERGRNGELYRDILYSMHLND